MIVFNTIFKIDAAEKSMKDIFCVCKKWISGGQRSAFYQDDLSNITLKDRDSCKKGDELIEVIFHKNIELHEYFGFRYTKKDHSTKNQWITTITVSRIYPDFQICLKLEVTNAEARPAITSAKKPIIVSQIIKDIGIAYDGNLIIESGVITADNVSENSLGILADLINGVGENQLPVVYISHPLRLTDKEIKTLSKDLEGMAHIITEPCSETAVKIRKLTKSRNPYNGAIGIYWKGGYNSRMTIEQATNPETISKIKKYITESLITMNTPEKLKWNSILDMTLSSKINELRAKQKNFEEYDELMQLVDEENHRLKSVHHEMEEKIRYLQDRLDREANKKTTNIEISHGEKNLFDDCICPH